jgi:hypothetical protein
VDLPLWKEPRYKLAKGVGVPQSRSGRYRGEKYLLLPSGIGPRVVGRQVSLADLPTKLSWFQ